MAMIGFDELERANPERANPFHGDFCDSYLIFHGILSLSRDMVFKYLPILSFAKCLIRQVDHAADSKRAQNLPSGTHINEEDPFRVLEDFISSKKCLDERIHDELRSGKEGWLLKRKLYDRYANKQEISVEDVFKSIELRAFNVRLLNLILYQLTGKMIHSFPLHNC